jgi:hypothetical protein
MAGFLNKVVATVGANSKALMDKAKINTAINNFEEERVKLSQMLGQKIYDMYKEQGSVSADENVVNFIAEIDKRLDAIEEQHEKLRRVEEELALVTGGGNNTATEDITCNGCGQSNRPGAKFCAGCGSTITT